MMVNPKIKELLQEISNKSIEYGNEPDKDRKYLKRMLNIFNKQLTDDEQLFVFKLMLEQIYYKNIIADPDNINQLNNIRLKTYSYIFLLSLLFLVVTAGLFKVNDSLNNIGNSILNIMKVLTL